MSYEDIKGLRASRNFKDQPLADDDLDAILEAARWTGSSKNNQDWSFVVVDTVAGREALADTGRFTRAVRNAPVTIALVKEPGGNDFDIGRASQNIMLAAQAVGVGSCAITLHDRPKAAEVLGLAADQEAHYAVALGYVDEEAEAAERAERRQGGWGGRKTDVVKRLDP